MELYFCRVTWHVRMPNANRSIPNRSAQSTLVQIQGFVQCHSPASISSSSFGFVTAGTLPGASWALGCYRGRNKVEHHRFDDLSDVSRNGAVMERTTAEPRPALATHQNLPSPWHHPCLWHLHKSLSTVLSTIIRKIRWISKKTSNGSMKQE